MAGKKQTEEEKRKFRCKKKCKEYIDTVRNFLTEKNGGTFPPEWELSVNLLETYYMQFLMINEEIDALPSLTIVGRYGPVPSPLLGCRDRAAQRIEQLMKELALTFKANIKLELSEPVAEESTINKFLKNKIETRSK